MDTKHTPGPWHLKTERTVKAGRKTVAVCPCDGITGLERDANARLIVAAPELLAAVNAAIKCGMVPKSSAKEGGAMRFSEQVRVADMIRDAIAKAEGEL